MWSKHRKNFKWIKFSWKLTLTHKTFSVIGINISFSLRQCGVVGKWGAGCLCSLFPPTPNPLHLLQTAPALPVGVCRQIVNKRTTGHPSPERGSFPHRTPGPVKSPLVPPVLMTHWDCKVMYFFLLEYFHMFLMRDQIWWILAKYKNFVHTQRSKTITII